MTSTNTTLLTLAGDSLDEAAELFAQLDEQTGLIPDHARATITATMDELRTSAANLGIKTMGALCSKIETLLRHSAHVDQVTTAHPTRIADPLHRQRNIALAWAMACAQSLDKKADPIVKLFPTLPARTAGGERAHTDDEIMLLRVNALDALRRAGGNKAAGVYAMVDAGATPAESTAITRNEFDAADDSGPTCMLIPRSNVHIAERLVDLDSFAVHVLTRVLRWGRDRGRAAMSPIAYDYSGGARDADSASVSAMLRRQHKRVGIGHADTVPSSTRRWRIQATFDQQGLDAAIEIAGQSATQLDRLITMLDAPDATHGTPRISSFIGA